MKKYITSFLVGLVGITSGLGMINDHNIINNNNVNVEYVENEDDTWEIYINVKEGNVSEINMNNKGDSLLVAPNIIGE